MAYTPMPPAPDRKQPATFADRGDAFLGALDNFGAEMEANRQQVNLNTAAVAANTATVQAAAGIATGAANFKGAWSTLSGAISKPASVSHAGKFWALLNNLGNVAASQPGVSADWVVVSIALSQYAYDARAALRSVTASDGDQAIVRGLGLFVFTLGSSALDDDETAFVSTGGAWELEAAGPDYVFGATAAAIDDLESRFLRGSFAMTLTTLGATTSLSFTSAVAGAMPGDHVVVTPGNSFGTTSANQAALSWSAYVSAPSVVTVSLRNASAGGASMTAATWSVLVIKQ